MLLESGSIIEHEAEKFTSFLKRFDTGLQTIAPADDIETFEEAHGALSDLTYEGSRSGTFEFPPAADDEIEQRIRSIVHDCVECIRKTPSLSTDPQKKARAIMNIVVFFRNLIINDLELPEKYMRCDVASFVSSHCSTALARGLCSAEQTDEGLQREWKRLASVRVPQEYHFSKMPTEVAGDFIYTIQLCHATKMIVQDALDELGMIAQIPALASRCSQLSGDVANEKEEFPQGHIVYGFRPDAESNRFFIGSDSWMHVRTLIASMRGDQQWETQIPIDISGTMGVKIPGIGCVLTEGGRVCSSYRTRYLPLKEQDIPPSEGKKPDCLETIWKGEHILATKAGTTLRKGYPYLAVISPSLTYLWILEQEHGHVFICKSIDEGLLRCALPQNVQSIDAAAALRDIVTNDVPDDICGLYCPRGDAMTAEAVPLHQQRNDYRHWVHVLLAHVITYDDFIAILRPLGVTESTQGKGSHTSLHKASQGQGRATVTSEKRKDAIETGIAITMLESLQISLEDFYYAAARYFNRNPRSQYYKKQARTPESTHTATPQSDPASLLSSRDTHRK